MDSFGGTLTAAIIGAAASVVAAALTFIFKLVADQRDRMNRQRSNVMGLRNEIALNVTLAVVIHHYARSLGFRFSDSVWRSSDTSSVYSRNVPWKKVLELYSDFQVYNALAERREVIEQHDDYPGREKRLATDRVEAFTFVERILETGSNVLEALNAYHGAG